MTAGPKKLFLLLDHSEQKRGADFLQLPTPDENDCFVGSKRARGHCD